jgi:uncharacterized protein (DUF934 family)
MRIIKDKLIIEDDWLHIADDAPLATGNITITQQRWLAEKNLLANHNGKLGLRLTSTDDLADISDDLEKFELIELYFSVFTDGRSFSMAKLLRDRYHYAGELRATGNFLRDQLFYLSRVGINSFNLGDHDNLDGAMTALDEFSVQYQ